jgi:Domain of unknown function (DUF4942)
VTWADAQDAILVEHNTVKELVRVYEQAESDIRRGFKMVVDALASLNGTVAAGQGNLYLRSRFNHHAVAHFDEPDDHLIHLRRDVWRILVERMQVRRAMSIAAWEKLEKEINDGDPPAITAENLNSMVEQFREDIPAMLKAAIGEVFEWLRPRGCRYKTNSQYEIGERVVLTGCVSRGHTKWDRQYYRSQHLIALENVFYMVDGKPRPILGYYADIETAIMQIPISQPCVGGTELFEFRGYRNGNLHLKFRRMDLVAKLNAIAGENRLKPTSAESAG